MVGGGLLSSLVIIPIIAAWGQGRSQPFYPETVFTIAEMSPHDLWHRYVRYIGASAVATAGLLTLIRSIPTMIESFRIGTSQIKARLDGHEQVVPRTKRDLPLKVVGWGVLAVTCTMAFLPHVFGDGDGRRADGRMRRSHCSLDRR